MQTTRRQLLGALAATGIRPIICTKFEITPEQTVDVVLSRADYTAVRSWSESAPPGLNANNVA